jgi:hypothetical protein
MIGLVNGWLRSIIAMQTFLKCMYFDMAEQDIAYQRLLIAIRKLFLPDLIYR